VCEGLRHFCVDPSCKVKAKEAVLNQVGVCSRAVMGRGGSRGLHACKECMQRAHSTTNPLLPHAHQPQVVDWISMRSFSELDPADVDTDPLIALPCGHTFATSTLDGHMEMAVAYGAAAHGGRSGPGGGSMAGSGPGGGSSGSSGSSSAAGTSVWGAPLALPDEMMKVKGCPQCRAPIGRVRRYGRVVNKAVVDLTQLKFVMECR